jgi:molybdate transport system substrate-binding protein
MLATLGGCGRGIEAGVDGDDVELVVFAAASLSDPFRQIGQDFERSRPGVTIVYSFGGTSQLRTQLEQGASADIFASADEANADRAATAGLIGPTRIFARNRLAVVVPEDNPGRIDRLADLGRPGVKVVLAQPDVPAGAYAAEVLDRAAASAGYGADFAARVGVNVVSREPNVKQVLSKVRLGEADAGIVYLTDAPESARTGQWAVRVVEIPEDLNVEASYPIAVTTRSRHQELARDFIDHVLSESGQEVLRRNGFTAP